MSIRRFSWFNAVSITFGFSFLYLPILLLVLYSFNESRLVTVWAGFSTKWYVELMNNQALRRDTEAKIAKFDVRPPDCWLTAKNFSGGNQQKIVVAREIERNPDLLLVGQPTRGVDIGAIEFIHRQIVALRDQGKAILLVSVELEEIFSLADRIAVMFDGRIMGERLPDQTDEKELGLLMAGVSGEAA